MHGCPIGSNVLLFMSYRTMCLLFTSVLDLTHLRNAQADALLNEQAAQNCRATQTLNPKP
jgi:hypothetical protein